MKTKYLAASIGISVISLIAVIKTATADVVVKWQEGDNSANIQKAINSGDDTIIIPNVGKPWIISDRILAQQSNQKIVFEPGVVLLAQKGSFKKVHTSMMMVHANNVTISGYGATFQMQRDDYLNPELYERSEFRHALVVRGSNNFVVEGLTLKDAGGDGLFVSHGKKTEGKNSIPERTFSSGIIRDIVTDNNYRLGLSIMSAKDLTVENSTFKNTSGTRPASGVDIEPDYGWQKLVNIQFNNNKFIDNARNGVQIALGKYRGEDTTDVSIAFDGCEIINSDQVGMKIYANKSGVYDGARGLISIKNCDIDGSGENGIFVKSDHVDPEKTIKLAFEDVTISNTANNTEEAAPVILHNTHEPGVVANIDFGTNFVIEDNFNRPAVYTTYFSRKQGLANIHGKIKVNNPKQEPSFLSDNLENVTLEIIK